MKKKVERKEKEIQNVVGGEGDENVEENKREVVWKTNRKEEEACSKEDETRVNKEDCKNTDEKIKELLSKTR